MSFSGKFTITKQDNIQYNFFRMKRKLAGIAIMTFVILAVMLALIRYAQGISITSSLLSALVVAIVGVILMVGFNLLSVVSRVNSLYKKGKMSDFTVHYIIDKTGVHAKSERGDTDFAWKQILVARETGNAFYLIAGENRAVVIPKAQIANDGELSMLRSLFQKYVVNRRAKS
ncbi:hypothetical protein SDC9_148128 [bioreactor metagenome]|uniref:YcxB-like C-terminal domain-containing protein n=1 Tax=bioreactor metagenome TaxID=1076179 RepID=A0A645EHX9_9ZZZZ|nr:YcxB family protein [Christensenella sp.]